MTVQEIIKQYEALPKEEQEELRTYLASSNSLEEKIMASHNKVIDKYEASFRELSK